MLRISLLFAAFAILAGCASTPDLSAYHLPSATGITGSIWADNQINGHMMIVSVDGKGMPSRGWNGYPYAITVSEGKHKLKVLVSQAPYYAHIDIDTEIEGGHAYALRFKSSYPNVMIYIVDLGPNKSCAYEIAGEMYGGYVPVELICS